MTSIKFLPQNELKELFEQDYKLMQENMFPDSEDSLGFNDLIQGLKTLNQKINYYELSKQKDDIII